MIFSKRNIYLLHSFNQQYFLQIQNNKINVNHVVSLTEMAFDSDSTVTDATRVVASECKDVTDADRCEAVFKIMECCRNVSIEKGYGRVDLL